MYRVITPLGTWLNDYPTEDTAKTAIALVAERWHGIYKPEDFRIIIIDCPSVMEWVQGGHADF